MMYTYTFTFYGVTYVSTHTGGVIYTVTNS